jgi:hypothetical protein
MLTEHESLLMNYSWPQGPTTPIQFNEKKLWWSSDQGHAWNGNRCLLLLLLLLLLCFAVPFPIALCTFVHCKLALQKEETKSRRDL